MKPRYLGPGKSRNYKPQPGWTLEEAKENGCIVTYETPPGFYCTVCDGCGCKCCGWSGEEELRQKRNRDGKNGPKKP